MALKSDREGFLQGDPIAIDRGSFGRALGLWQKIHADIGDIRKALVDDGASVARSRGRVNQRTEPKEAAAPAVAPVATPRRARTTEAAAIVKAVEAATPKRATNGRFTKGGENDKPKHDPVNDPREPSNASRAAGAIAESVKSGVGEALSGTEQVDPAIAAAKEVGGVVGPLLKPLGALFGKGFFGGKDKDKEAVKPHEPWYKRILKRLKTIDEGQGGSGQSASPLSIGGIAGMFTAVLPMLGGLIAGAIPMLVAAGGTLVAGGVGYLVGSLINDKWGTVIGDAIWDASEFIKDKWGKTADWFTTTWSDITGKVTSWIDNLLGLPGKVVEKGHQLKDAASSWVGNKTDAVKSFFGGGSAGNKKAIISEMSKAGITDPKEAAMFLSQMDHESGGFKSYEENLNYSADGLMKTFPKYYKNAADAQRDARNPEAIANKVYGGRMGNTEAGDGYKFRGRGAIQLTGKANYEEAGKALGMDLVSNPDMAQDPEVAAKIATWYWKNKGASVAAKGGDVAAVTRKINGGTNGLADRQAKYQSYLGAFEAGTIRPEHVGDVDPSPYDPEKVAKARAVAGRVMEVQASAPLMLKRPQAATPAVTASAGTGTAAPALDKLTPAPAPAITTPIGSNDKSGGRTEVNIPMPIGQNMADRQIAHLATGGMAAGG